MSRPRLPTPSDFPPNLTLTITPPPSSHPPTNILLLLHGLGDTHQPFSTLSKNLNLPETACISLRGPNPIPPLFIGEDSPPAFHWGDDVVFDERKGEIELDGAGFEMAKRVIMEIVVEEVLVGKCGYGRRGIFFLGFGQGGMVGLVGVASSSTPNPSSSQSPLSSNQSSSPPTPYEYGGIISIGACLPRSFTQSPSTPKNKTPVLILSGSRSTQVTKEKLDWTRQVFEGVEVIRWAKGEDSMPARREEMLPIMQFWGRRLRSVAGVPEGAREIG